MSPNVMIIGANGRMGLALIRAAADLPSRPQIHAFLRTPSKLPAGETALCQTVQQGDALQSSHVARALAATKADTVIMAIGVANSVAKSDLRERSAKALVSVVKPGSKFDHVRVVVVSSDGAGGSKINIGMGVGTMLGFYLRHVLRDHDKQEEAFSRGLATQKKRLLIVRPTGLGEGKPTGKVATFGDEKAPTAKIDRADVALYIFQQICGEGSRFGTAVNITTAK